MWEQTLHDVLEPIGIVQTRGLSSSHQYFGNYFEDQTLIIQVYMPMSTYQDDDVERVYEDIGEILKENVKK